MSARPAIRILSDRDEARAFLLRPRRLQDTQLPPAVQARVREIFGRDLSADEVVARVLDDVARDGDRALRRYSRLIERVEVDDLEVTDREIAAARRAVPDDVLAALSLARDRIDAFHQRQKRASWIDFGDDGALGQVLRPLERVGIYTPAGRAPYPSSLLMSAVPARVAGVEQIIVCVPPDPTGAVSPVILAAAAIAGVDRVFKIGGAQAIAAMAYGTESVPKVDKILGPGNIFVVLAKRRVYGEVDIDQLPGPTETLIIADASADPALVAADLLAQAEHDPLASAVLITTDAGLAREVRRAVDDQLADLERAAIARESLAANGAIALADDLDEAFELANGYAAEHLCLHLRDAWSHVGRVRHAGGIFIGESSPEVLGDYTAGPSHVMPTGRTARFSSPLNLDDFMKVITVIGLNPSALRRYGPAAATIARAEGLTAHARAVERRLESR